MARAEWFRRPDRKAARQRPLPQHGTPYRIELRIDVDRAHPLTQAGADHYSVSDTSVTYFGSMRLDAATVKVSPTLVTIKGTDTYTFATGFPNVKISIPRVTIVRPQAPSMGTYAQAGVQNARR